LSDEQVHSSFPPFHTVSPQLRSFLSGSSYPTRPQGLFPSLLSIIPSTTLDCFQHSLDVFGCRNSSKCEQSIKLTALPVYIVLFPIGGISKTGLNRLSVASFGPFLTRRQEKFVEKIWKIVGVTGDENDADLHLKLPTLNYLWAFLVLKWPSSHLVLNFLSIVKGLLCQ
jgi:hypothetical protein